MALAVSLAIALGAFAFTASPNATAAPLNGFVGGSILVNTGGLFSLPQDVVVYTGDTPTRADDRIVLIEATTSPNHRVHVLDGDGNFERLWGKNAIRPGAKGNAGNGFEVCTQALTGAAGCQEGDAGDKAGELDNPSGVAVSQSTGHVYVMDRGNRRVQEYTLEGAFVRAWGWDVIPDGASGDLGSAFEVCTSSCQAGQTTAPGDQAGQFSDAAIINSIAVSPISPNDVYVTDGGNQRILQFESDGDFRRGWGYNVSPVGSPGFETCEGTGTDCQAGETGGTPDDGKFAASWPRHIAIDTDGVVYASDGDTSALPASDDRIVRFDSDPPPGLLLEPLPGSLLTNGRTAGLEVDPTTGNLYAGRDNSTGGEVVATVDEIDDPGAPVSGGPPNPALVETHVLATDADDVAGSATRNLGIDPATGNLYLTAPALFTPSTTTGKFTGCVSPNSHACSGLIVFADTTGPLSGTIDVPSDVGTTTATLEGTVNPGGGTAKYQFQISSDGSNWADVGQPRYATGSANVDASTEVSGLEPATLYSARITVTKQTGIASTESVTSAETVFLTDAAAPAVTTLGSTRRTDTSVRLRGLVDPQGSDTTYRFEYGPAGGSFDQPVPDPDAPAGNGNSPERQTFDLTGLQPETSYHYRIVATNFVGTTVGDPVTFTTKATEPPPPPPPGRGYELVSPAQKISGVGTGVWYNGPAAGGLSGYAAYEGERFAVQGTFGAVLVDGKYALANDWSLSERTPQGWVNEPLLSRRAHGAQPIVFIQMPGAQPDLSLMAWGGTTVKLFAEMEGWIKEVVGGVLYLRDWNDGKWEVFGPTSDIQSSGPGLTESAAVAADAPAAVASGPMRGLAGPADPTLDLPSSVEHVYLDEVPGGLSDTFPGAGVRSLVNACTPGTQIPRVDTSGGDPTLSSQNCPPAAPDRSAAVISPGGAVLGKDRESVISHDGGRIFFMSPNPGNAPSSCSGADAGTTCPAQVYVRQRDGSNVTTRWISRSEIAGQDASLMAPVIFEGASANGDKVFFRTASPLTDDDPNGEGQAPPPGGITTGTPNEDSWDLYMYDMPDAPGADPADGDLIRISAGPDGDGDCNSPLVTGTSEAGALRYVSDDGSRLYFTCAAALDGVPLADDGTITSPGGAPTTGDQTNLYAYDADQPLAQRYRFVARLPRLSTLGACATTGVRLGVPLGPKNDADADLSVFDRINCVHGLDDGSAIVFWTDGQLTDDDPDADTGDIYLYDADQDELTRVTAPQGGGGNTYQCAIGFSTVECYGDGGVGVSAGETPLPKLGIARDPGSGDLLAFFQSRSQLLAEDADNGYDVYQWRASELSLISTGQSATDGAYFAGNDSTGLNVYLATRDRLSWQDKDSVLDVYSARRGGGIPEPPSTEENCNVVGDQCQGPGQAPGAKQIDSDAPGAGNPPSTGRLTLSISAPSAKARRRAARTGKLTIGIRTSSATTLRLTARARMSGRTRKVASARKRIGKAGASKVTLRLSKAARKRLRTGKTLRVSIAVKATGARTVATSVRLSRQ